MGRTHRINGKESSQDRSPVIPEYMPKPATTRQDRAPAATVLALNIPA